MILTRIGIQGVRNLADADIEPAPGANLVVGPNASGKTSLLESIYLLAHARSFRTPHVRTVVNTEADRLLVHCEIRNPDTGTTHRLGVERGEEGMRLRLDQQEIRQTSRLAQVLPVQLLTPETAKLMEQGPGQRRRFMDWGLFHVEQTFHGTWTEYSRALKQRNAALRSGASDESVRIWDAILIQQGELITELRERYVEALSAELVSFCSRLLGFSPRFAYRRGWRRESDLAQALADAITRDRQQGSTTVGPHRADLACLVDGAPAQERLSRGQLKMLVSTMRLAQSAHLARIQGRTPVFLVDDIAAELDPTRRRELLALLRESGAQLFLTATEPEQLDVSPWESHRVFHVEHGKIAEVV